MKTIVRKKGASLFTAVIFCSCLLFAGAGYSQDAGMDSADQPVLAASGSVSGTVFHDSNQNEAMDPGEPGVPGTTVTLSRLYFGFIPSEVGTVITDANGKYQFTGLPMGIYQVAESHTQQPDASTTPDKVVFYIGLSSQSQTRTINFGDLTPPIVSITANPLSIIPGQSVLLSWTTENGTTATIEPGIGPVDLNGSIPVAPVNTTTYILSVTGPGGTATDSVTVEVISTTTTTIIITGPGIP